jgi:hypothetical protein
MTKTRMILCCTVLTLTVIVLGVGGYVSAQTYGSRPLQQSLTTSDPQLPGPTFPCSTASFSPEVTTYYGDSGAVIDKIDNAQINVENRRAYMVLIETKDSAELAFFERHGKNITVRHWSGKTAGDFREVAAKLILENRGIACIGEQLKHVVIQQFHPENLGDIPVPVSLRSASAHAIQQHGSQYMRVTAFLLC